MNKCQIKTKLGITQLIIKSQKGQQLSEREIYAINTNEVKGLLHLDVVQKGSKFQLVYNITGFITFKEYLNRTLDKEAFARILKNILENLKSTQETFINQQMLLLDFEHTLVNPATEKIYFTCVPIQGIETGTSLREFLLDVTQYASFKKGEDNSCVREYISILNSGINFSVFELEEYINKLTGEKPAIQEDKKECPTCNKMIKAGTNYCPYCGSKVTGMTGNCGKGVYDPLKPDQDKVYEEKEAVVTGGGGQKSNTQGLSSGTTVLGVNFDGTTVLGSEERHKLVYPCLIREKNKEKILINKPSFRLGKGEDSCDYCILDNTYISRNHADIITREGRYFIKDLSSTNKTYLNDSPIPGEYEVEIFPGAKIKLANEKFVFHKE